MGRKSKERIVLEWLESHRARIGNDAFNRVVEVLKEDYPEVTKTRPPGRPRATADPGTIIDGGLMNELDDYGLLTDIFNLFGNRGKDLARLAVCLMEIGFFKSENNKRTRFAESTKAIYNLICEYKDFTKNPVSYQSFMIELDAIENEEMSYPKEEREKDKQMMLDILEMAKEQCRDYYEYLLTECGWNDLIYDC